MMAGLIPFLFMAAYSSSERVEALTFHEGERVVVYALPACCQDAEYAASLQELLTRLPSDAVVLEAPGACACPASAAPVSGAGFSPFGVGLRDTTVHRNALTGRVIVPKEEVASFYAELADLYPMPYTSALLGIPAVEGVAIPPAAPLAAAGVPRWVGVLAVPLLFAAGGGGDQPDPPGVICPDTGITTGPERPRC